MIMISFADALVRFRASTEQPQVYETILQGIAASLSPEERQAICRCEADAERLHYGQLRQDGASYIVHPRRVAILTASYSAEKLERDDIIIALAHDLIEDCGITEEWLARNYGARVATGVRILSAPGAIGESREQRRNRKSAKYSALSNADIGVLRVHAMDVLDNTISWRFIEPDAEGWQKIPRWMWQVVHYQIPLLSKHFGNIAEELRGEIAYQRHRGFEIGSWESP